jgi:hypothetical protein
MRGSVAQYSSHIYIYFKIYSKILKKIMNNIIHSKYKRINIVSAQYLPPHILVYLE